MRKSKPKKQNGNSTRLIVPMPRELIRELRRMSDSTGVPVARLIRRFVAGGLGKPELDTIKMGRPVVKSP